MILRARTSQAIAKVCSPVSTEYDMYGTKREGHTSPLVLVEVGHIPVGIEHELLTSSQKTIRQLHTCSVSAKKILQRENLD